MGIIGVDDSKAATDTKSIKEKAIDDWLPITSSMNAKWWHSTFHNVTAMVGAGVPSLPHAMSNLGWGLFADDFWGVGNGNHGVSRDDFFVDDLLNFSNGELEEEEDLSIINFRFRHSYSLPLT
ncbi:hypothetical protein GIB67_018253 [Kingdonia uniflora]|uniref:Amino acid transporter transmembrane domain-containing protein n=1 Tax=Kingdonia uniflora TaxID=39325 RepID=A0A7J7LEW4_9MAGN|nr:hypothetical protein GIB67_018253 [Kingdonia uniflora]